MTNKVCYNYHRHHHDHQHIDLYQLTDHILDYVLDVIYHENHDKDESKLKFKLRHFVIINGWLIAAYYIFPCQQLMLRLAASVTTTNGTFASGSNPFQEKSI